MNSAEPRPPVPAWDTAISIVSLVFTVMLGGLAVLAGIFSLAFLDYCPPETCSADGAVTAVALTVVALAMIGVTGLVLTVVRLARRRLSWPFSVGTLGLCLVVCVAGVGAYAAAVGA